MHDLQPQDRPVRPAGHPSPTTRHPTNRQPNRPRRICNRKIISHVQQVICFAFHDSKLLLETCEEAKGSKRIVTLFYLD